MIFTKFMALLDSYTLIMLEDEATPLASGASEGITLSTFVSFIVIFLVLFYVSMTFYRRKLVSRLKKLRTQAGVKSDVYSINIRKLRDEISELEIGSIAEIQLEN